MVPLLDTFDNIKECMGATSVQLPSPKDFVMAAAPAKPSSANNPPTPACDQAPQTVRSSSRHFPYDCYAAKEWNPLFSKDRSFNECSFYLETIGKIGAEDDLLSIWLQNFEEMEPCYMTEELREFCEDVHRDDRKSDVGLRRAAWLDDRKFAHPTIKGGVRIYQNPLSAAALYRLLKEPV